MKRYFIDLELKVNQDDLMYYYAVCEIKIEKKMFFPVSPIKKTLISICVYNLLQGSLFEKGKTT